jgi:hypothetical protein
VIPGEQRGEVSKYDADDDAMCDAAGWSRREADIADRVVSMRPARSRRRVMTADLQFHPAAQPIHTKTFVSTSAASLLR